MRQAHDFNYTSGYRSKKSKAPKVMEHKSTTTAKCPHHGITHVWMTDSNKESYCDPGCMLSGPHTRCSVPTRCTRIVGNIVCDELLKIEVHP